MSPAAPAGRRRCAADTIVKVIKARSGGSDAAKLRGELKEVTQQLQEQAASLADAHAALASQDAQLQEVQERLDFADFSDPPASMRLSEIWSGGQTGVDRAAWDAARELGLDIGGWVPKGRRAEDGTIPLIYDGLQETASAEYGERTTLNVRDTDATLILVRGALEGGSAFTRDEAVRLSRPCLVADLRSRERAVVASIRSWLAQTPGTRLNVAGPRAPELYPLAKAVLVRVLLPGE